MFRRILLLCLLLIGFVMVFFGQDKQITNNKHKFTLNYPNGTSATEGESSILEFRGTKENYGTDALFFLKTVMPVTISPLEKLESFMKSLSTVEGMNGDFIGSMKQTFPDIKSLDSSFIYFNERPTIQGIYSFTTTSKIPMKGRFMLILVKEQSSIYAFSWTSKASMYEKWNTASEAAVKSLKINSFDSNMAFNNKLIY